jgi:hypothetical protein
MSASAHRLPPGFDELLPFVDAWAGATTQERLHTRCSSSMDEIRRFYDAMTARADEAMAYVERFPLRELPDDAALLFRLVLALGQAHVAVEIHGRPCAPNTPYPHGIRILRGVTPYG